MENSAQKRILMALSRFDIGGAETHVLELSLELQRMGYYVVVVSSGGVYEENLKEAGISHYTIPLNSKTPAAMKASLSKLKQVIKEEKIDIVHAHGRIPAFLCHILNRFMKFTFVTTAHWVFELGHGLKYVTRWGKKVIAVSEDIKTYLMENYHTKATDIYVTINGIDTEKFSKNADTKSIIEEFSLSSTSKKIVYISRMDEDRAQVAFELVEIAPEIVKICPDVEIVIVGGGNVFDQLKEKTDEMNKRLSKRHIILTGGRTDIYKFAALADVFVGVSRSALEAMACEKPVIVAGNEGYIGIFDADKLDVSINTNFCCRGLSKSSPEKLLVDMTTLLTNSEEENARLGTFGRNLILNSYSLSKMAKDCETMYLAATDTKKWDAVISGYYGYQNSGDESLLYAIIENLKRKKEDMRILVLSKDPKSTEKRYGVDAINRYHLCKIRTALKNSKMLIFGGGSLIQDVTSDKSLWYYLTIIKMALSKCVPVFLYANGIGPVIREKNRKKVLNILNQADKISLRDSDSYEEVKRMGVNLDKVTVTADPALTIEGIEKEEARGLLECEGIPVEKKLLGVSVRNWKLLAPSYWDELAHAIEKISKTYDYVPVFIPLKTPEDIELSETIQKKMDIESYTLKKVYNAREIVGVVGACDLMVAMRLHSVIYAANAGVPAIGISYDPKVSGFMKDIGIENILYLDEFSEEKLVKMCDTILAEKEKIQKDLKEKAKELSCRALLNADMVMDFIQNPKV